MTKIVRIGIKNLGDWVKGYWVVKPVGRTQLCSTQLQNQYNKCKSMNSACEKLWGS